MAFALQADGWWLRSDIIWAKKNCMPESVRDRPTRSHEYLFLLAKSPTYYYDADAIKEPASYSVEARKARAATSHKSMPPAERNGIRPAGFKDATSFDGKHADKQRGHSRRHDGFNDRWDAMSKEEQCAGYRNKRDVWWLSTEQFPEAHFAVFPEQLVEPCILAGTSEQGCCTSCGTPWVREIKVEYAKNRPSAGNDLRSRGEDRLSNDEARGHGGWKGNNLLRRPETLGWHPTCPCQWQDKDGNPIRPSPTQPCIVLDPFMGAGTTALVAARLNRRFLGCELNPDYVAMAEHRIADEVAQGKFF